LEEKYQNLQKNAIKKSPTTKKHVSSISNQLSGKLQALSFRSFCLFIIVELFAAKLAGYTYMKDIRDRNVNLPMDIKFNSFALKSQKNPKKNSKNAESP